MTNTDGISGEQARRCPLCGALAPGSGYIYCAVCRGRGIDPDGAYRMGWRACAVYLEEAFAKTGILPSTAFGPGLGVPS